MDIRWTPLSSAHTIAVVAFLIVQFYIQSHQWVGFGIQWYEVPFLENTNSPIQCSFCLNTKLNDLESNQWKYLYQLLVLPILWGNECQLEKNDNVAYIACCYCVVYKNGSPEFHLSVCPLQSADILIIIATIDNLGLWSETYHLGYASCFSSSYLMNINEVCGIIVLV